jgi:hypothetical protein
MHWINVKDEMPENGHYMLTDGDIVISGLKLDGGWLIPPQMNGVTHWMPMPMPPLKDDKAEEGGIS